jgi:PhoH-like ATPase
VKSISAKKSDTSPTKHYVLDTNVLIHDPQAMFQFEDNVVWIPVEVLEELDRFKSESTRAGRTPGRCIGS